MAVYVQTSVKTGIDGFGGAYNNHSALATNFPDTPFATELKTVAQAMRASRDLGLKRQVYFVSYGGFDSHRNQFNRLPYKQSTLSNGVQSFSNAMKELGMWNDLTLFSCGDFGRGFLSNGGGTDHACGTDHFVAGGAIKGKNVFGSMPGYFTEGEEYTVRGARLIPSTSIEQ